MSGTNDPLDTADAPDEMEPSSWRKLTVDLEGKEKNAIAYYYPDDLDYYLVTTYSTRLGISDPP